MDGTRSTARRLWLRMGSPQFIWAVSIAIAITGVALAWWLLEPPCPTTIEIATGSADGQYRAFAEQYRELLAESGITLNIRETAGSVENAALLRDASSGVDIAIVQGGAVPHDDSAQITSLASLYYEPLWVFYRDQGEAAAWQDLSHLRGKRFSIGPEGSGTRALANLLLAENNIADGKANTQTLSLGGTSAADALSHGEIDAAFFVISPQSTIVKRLLQTPGVKLLNFRRAPAYSKKFPYLKTVALHEGLLDFENNLPAAEVQLLAPTASLVARKQLHASLTPLLLHAATRVHERGGYLESAGEFPSGHGVDFALSEPARRHFSRGPSVFYRYLPFLWAAWADRVKVMVLPLMTLMIPMFKFAPPVYRWSIRSKIYRWYRVLREVDQEMRSATSDIDFAREIEQLQRVELELAEVSVPLSYMDEFYNLRTHVAFVLNRLRAMEQQSSEEAAVLKLRKQAA